jgi:hypothetical protein
VPQGRLVEEHRSLLYPDKPNPPELHSKFFSPPGLIIREDMKILSKHPFLITAIILVVIFLAWFFWQVTAIGQESEYHEFQYRVTISTQSVLENVTLLLPVPFVHNTSLLGDALVRGEGYGIPPLWRLSLERVNDTPMLKIAAEKIAPEYHGYPIPLEPGSSPVQTPPPVATAYSPETPVLIPLEFGISERVPQSIDTQNPLNREPLFTNPELVRSVPCQGQPFSGRCYQYTAPIYVEYVSGGMGTITIFICGGGINQWWMGGWSGNSYGDTLDVTLENNRQGWIQVEGFLSTGNGRY